MSARHSTRNNIHLGPSQLDSSVGDIHSLYQDLFLTDIKKEVEQAQQQLKTCKQEQNTANFEYQQLKKENQQLNATLKRYRKLLQDLTNEQKLTLNGKDRGRMNPSQISLSETQSKTGLKRRDSQSSFISNTTN